MTGGRYPFEHFTRGDLGPTERHRAAVFLRDDYRCLAAGGVWAVVTPCAGGLTLHRAAPTGPAVELGPVYLRTFCVAHQGLVGCDSGFDAACHANGWTVPLGLYTTPDPEHLPVRYPNGRWYLLDRWGDRQPLTPGEARRAVARAGLPTRGETGR